MTAEAAHFRQQLLEYELLFETGVDGVYGRSAVFQSAADAVNRLISDWARGFGATVVHLPPVETRRTFERTNYLESFPDLVGSVGVFTGDDRDHASLLRRVRGSKDWSESMGPADVVLCPSVCHAVYPICSGPLPPEGRTFDVRGTCFRNEPSGDPARMRSFEMHELVFVGSPEAVAVRRDQWILEGLGLLTGLGLEMRAEEAHDPFFGRLGQMLADEQRDAGLKVEGVTEIYSGVSTALLSANYHRDHFGSPFGIETTQGKPAHSTCIGFGVDRVILALLRKDGMDPGRWADAVRAQLGL